MYTLTVRELVPDATSVDTTIQVPAGKVLKVERDEVIYDFPVENVQVGDIYHLGPSVKRVTIVSIEGGE
jgi:hypothetical protein